MASATERLRLRQERSAPAPRAVAPLMAAAELKGVGPQPWFTDVLARLRTVRPTMKPFEAPIQATHGDRGVAETGRSVSLRRWPVIRQNDRRSLNRP